MSTMKELETYYNLKDSDTLDFIIHSMKKKYIVYEEMIEEMPCVKKQAMENLVVIKSTLKELEKLKRL